MNKFAILSGNSGFWTQIFIHKLIFGISMGKFILFIFAIIVHQNLACGTEDCPVDCEDRYKCIDKSELCAQLKNHCENIFFRKCLRCACPKTCGVCGDSSSSEESDETTTTTITTTKELLTTMTVTNSTIITLPISTTLEPTSMSTGFPTTIEVISDEEFKNSSKMKCKSCDSKRQKLAEIYDKYYPK